MKVSRRAFLSSAAAAGVLAGCLGGGESAASGGGESDTGRTESGSTPAASSAAESPAENGAGSATGTGATATNIDHPAATDLAAQPALGPAPGTAAATMVAFEDPSCTNCERFNTGAFPELESKLIEPGTVSYVYRNYPYAYEWGRPAMGALEATLSRGEDAFWGLKEHYFATQDQFSTSNVLDRTREFLESETGVDASGVIEDVEAGKFDAAVKRDIDAGNAAGVVSTPTFFLFRDGAFLTEIRGAQSYQVFEQALGVQ